MITTYCIQWLSYEDNLQHSKVLDLEHEIEAWQLACEAVTGIGQGTLLGLTKEELIELTAETGIIGVTEATRGDTETDD
jgi:hypothetical protein